MTVGDYCSLPKLSGSTLLQSFPREGPGEAGGQWALLAAGPGSSRTRRRAHTAGTSGWRSCCRIAALQRPHGPDAQQREHRIPQEKPFPPLVSLPTDFDVLTKENYLKDLMPFLPRRQCRVHLGLRGSKSVTGMSSLHPNLTVWL